MNYKYKIYSKVALTLITIVMGLIPAFSGAAGGVSLGATRIIYNQNDKQSSISLQNSDVKNRYLVQSWVEDLEGNKNYDFIITPPLFVMSKKSENNIRLVNLNEHLPRDRESAYWLNVKAIPEVEKTR